MCPQLYVPTALCVHSSMCPQLYVPTAFGMDTCAIEVGTIIIIIIIIIISPLCPFPPYLHSLPPSLPSLPSLPSIIISTVSHSWAYTLPRHPGPPCPCPRHFINPRPATP